MKLSIIVPCYNVEHTVKKCIESLLNSTYEDKEIILVDDGSSDNTSAIIMQYAHDYRNIFAYSKVNEGLGKTRNYGIKHSAGELITFIDSDDYIQPEAYSNMIDRLNKTNADVVYCGFRYVYKNREKTDAFDCKELYTNTAELMEYILNEHRCFAGLSACTGIYKRSIIEKISDGPFLSEREFLSEDKLFNIIYLQNANVAAIINASYYYYVQQSVGSITTTFKEYKIQAAYNMCQKMLEINKVSELIPFILIDYLVSLSACFHQICADDALGIKKKLSEISLVVNNNDYQECLKNINTQMLSAKFRLVYWMIRLKMEGGIYLLYSANCLVKNWKNL